ncbi:MAG: hypothetical protein ACJAVI_001278 [Candidatus Azotimanducaceae bacterium]|jgi:hypothetical protein
MTGILQRPFPILVKSLLEQLPSAKLASRHHLRHKQHQVFNDIGDS